MRGVYHARTVHTTNANVRRVQALALLFARSRWTQEKLAKKEAAVGSG